jgi:hypothetical protein
MNNNMAKDAKDQKSLKELHLELVDAVSKQEWLRVCELQKQIDEQIDIKLKARVDTEIEAKLKRLHLN